MEILSIVNLSLIVFVAFIVIILVAIILLVISMIKDRKDDLEEIEDLQNDLNIEQLGEKEIDDKVYKNQTDLQNLLIKMQEDLEAKSTDVINRFENDQEEKSIISYQELVKTLKNEEPIDIIEEAIQPKEEIVDPKVETVEPIKTEIQTDFGEITKVEIPKIKEEKKFKNTEFISPIYGKQSMSNDYPTVKEFKRPSRIDMLIDKENDNTTIEEDINLDPIREEIKRNDEFLNALKEFRKNL